MLLVIINFFLLSWTCFFFDVIRRFPWIINRTTLISTMLILFGSCMTSNIFFWFFFLLWYFQITFELTMKQLMSFDPCEWTESLRKEYVLVIEGFFSVPLPIFSPTYRRAIKVKILLFFHLILNLESNRSCVMNGKWLSVLSLFS